MPNNMLHTSNMINKHNSSKRIDAENVGVDDDENRENAKEQNDTEAKTEMASAECADECCTADTEPETEMATAECAAE